MFLGLQVLAAPAESDWARWKNLQYCSGWDMGGSTSELKKELSERTQASVTELLVLTSSRSHFNMKVLK